MPVTLSPQLNARFRQYRELNNLLATPDGEAFEEFVNATVVSNYLGKSVSSEQGLIDVVSAGGYGDLGLDGVVFKVNEIIISSNDEIDLIIQKHKKINIEIIFIQSKYKREFRREELSSFFLGIKRFLTQSAGEVSDANEKLKYLLSIKDKLFSESTVLHWGMNALKLKALFVQLENVPQRNDVAYLVQDLMDFTTSRFNSTPIELFFIDSNALLQYCMDNEKTISVTLIKKGQQYLSPSAGVDNSLIATCSGDEFVKMLLDESGDLRRSLFEDNVRDYQGQNIVNAEILNTIKSDPTRFSLLNNGVTIVCDSMNTPNNFIHLDNPQIVNGCQTSNVLYEAYKLNYDLSKVEIIVKIIATSDSTISNSIVRGSNRQTNVLEEAFETTKRFHKDLEDFFVSATSELGFEPTFKVYYERRARQYDSIPNIQRSSIVSFRVLIQQFVSCILNKPHLAHRHESVLLKEFSGTIFKVSQIQHSYFLVGLFYVKYEEFFKSNPIPKEWRNFKNHIVYMLFIKTFGKFEGSIDDSDYVFKFYHNAVSCFKDLSSNLLTVVDSYKNIVDKWISLFNKSAYGIKESQDFTKFLADETPSAKKIVPRVAHANVHASMYDESIYTSQVLFTTMKNDNWFGFIQFDPENIYFNSNFHKELDFRTLPKKMVEFKIVKNSHGREFAKILKVLD